MQSKHTTKPPQTPSVVVGIKKDVASNEGTNSSQKSFGSIRHDYFRQASLHAGTTKKTA